MWRSGLASLALVVATACMPYGFAGGGLPQHVRTIAVLPFENETSTPELQRQLQELMRRELRNRLGVREASEAKADAVVRGTITRYDVDVPISFSTDPNVRPIATRRKLQILVDIEIVDQTDGKTLWQRKGLSADGDYNEGAEESGRRQALDKLVNDIVQGAQSQW
jgi:lipopolysaccharide assembly LptE-like protein